MRGSWRLGPGLEIEPGVHAVSVWGAMAHVIVDDGGITLIDSGLPGSRGRLAAHLAGLGHDPGDVVRVICTHGHPDHAGGVRGLRRDGLEVLMHPADIAGVGVRLATLMRHPSRSRLFAYVTPTPANPRAIQDGEVLPVLGGLEVIHTPGHTPGSVCLFQPDRGLLFVGDALEMRNGRVDFASARYSDDRLQAEASVARMAERDVRTIVFSHYRPWRDDAKGVLEALAHRAREGTR